MIAPSDPTLSTTKPEPLATANVPGRDSLVVQILPGPSSDKVLVQALMSRGVDHWKAAAATFRQQGYDIPNTNVAMNKIFWGIHDQLNELFEVAAPTRMPQTPDYMVLEYERPRTADLGKLAADALNRMVMGLSTCQNPKDMRQINSFADKDPDERSRWLRQAASRDDGKGL